MRTIQLWYKRVCGLNKCNWLAALAPNYAKPRERVHCPGEAWDILRSDYLRREAPTFASCYARLQLVAKEHGWTLPSRQTLLARMNASPVGMRVHKREGADKLKALYPAQRRDYSVFHALEAVNADGHKFDVFVEWLIGNETRIVLPVLVGFQDIYSEKILSWRIDISENKEFVRLAFGDMVEKYGIPKYCYLDNGRNFASKWLTGGVPNRYRFKVLDDEPIGIMPQLGVEVHWTKPYSSQSKPIERAWRDFASGTSPNTQPLPGLIRVQTRQPSLRITRVKLCRWTGSSPWSHKVLPTITPARADALTCVRENTFSTRFSKSLIDAQL